MTQTVICAKWGTRYPASYVNCLWSMIRRNTTRETRLVCYTDDPAGIDPAVATFPMPELRLPERVANQPWRKISLWEAVLEGVSGNVLFVDLFARRLQLVRLGFAADAFSFCRIGD